MAWFKRREQWEKDWDRAMRGGKSKLRWWFEILTTPVSGIVDDEDDD